MGYRPRVPTTRGAGRPTLPFPQVPLLEIDVGPLFPVPSAFVDVARLLPDVGGYPRTPHGRPSPSILTPSKQNLTALRQPEREFLDDNVVPALARRLACKEESHTPQASCRARPRSPTPLPNRISLPCCVSNTKPVSSPTRPPTSTRLPSTIIELETRMEGVAQAPPRAFLPPLIASLSLSRVLCTRLHRSAMSRGTHLEAFRKLARRR